jgi:arylsulfatase A-like enzyme/Tfp pilus assembly protein PilF
VLLGALLLAAATLACVRSPRDRGRDAGLSVLLITIDTLRADALGAYGNSRVETPWIDRLAAQGVRFELAHAQNVVTLPSHANILAGRYPLAHGIRDNGGFRFPVGTDSLATILKARGYRTGAFVSAFPLDSRFGLDRGFEVYDDRFGNVDSHTAFVMEQRRGSETVSLARQWIAAQRDARFFCWLHLFDPHFPYDPPEPFASRFAAAPYYGEVAAADAALGPLLEPLLQAGRGAGALVVLTSDHGESLGEHGEMTHGIFAYEATLRVPLILFAPRLFGPRVVADPVRHVDLLPTVLDALALPAPKDLPGSSLLPLASGGRRKTGSSYFESLSSAKNRGWAPLYGVIHERVKFIDLPIPELYDLARDPHETQNLAAARPQLLEDMRARLGGLRSLDPGWRNARESAEIRERLESLGYLTAATPTERTRYTEDDDPKRLIALDAQLQAAIDHYKAGDLARARALCADVVRRRPEMPLALGQLAFLHREAGDLQAAVATLEKALALDPSDATSAALLGAYLNEQGQARKAIQVLEPYGDQPEPDIDALMALGAAFAQAGRARDALITFGKARALDPSNPMALVNIATVHLAARDYPRARDSLAAALALNPRLARAHNALGVIAAETGRPEEAIQRWRAAVALEPKAYDTVYNLGLMLRKAGRFAEARPYLERFVLEAPPVPYAADVATVRGWLTTAGPPSRRLGG